MDILNSHSKSMGPSTSVWRLQHRRYDTLCIMLRTLAYFVCETKKVCNIVSLESQTLLFLISQPSQKKGICNLVL
jgi:hypothetical protein